jgi:hypothetical protein
MRRVLAVGACAVIVWATAGASEPPPTVEQLVAQLGAESYADREAASKALDAIGAPAVPALEAAAASENPEVARRATRLLAGIRRRADSTLVASKTVRLEYRNVPLAVALHDLKARTGLNLALDPDRVTDPLRPVTCSTADLPAWEAVAAFCRAAGLREVFLCELPVSRPNVPPDRTYYVPPGPPPTAEAVPVVLIDGSHVELPGSRTTAVRVLVLPPTFPGHRVILGTGETTLCFDVTPTPGLHWQDAPAIRISRVIDDAGQAGESVLPPARNELDPFHTEWATPRYSQPPPMPPAYPNPRVVRVPLRLATPAARSLRLLEGAVIGEVIVPAQPLVTIENPTTSVGRVLEGPSGLKVSVLEVQNTERHVRIRVQSEYPSPWVARRKQNGIAPLWPEPPRQEGMTNQVKALDAAGRPVDSTSDLIDLRDDGDNIIMVQQFNFPREAGVPAKLVVVGPRSAVVEIPFRIENVPLP